MLPSNQKYLVFDTETEGLNLHSSKTWQLSWIVCQGSKVLETHDKFIKHKELNIPEVVRKLTGFDWDKYNSKAESLISVWSKFEKYLFDPQYIVVGQNLLGFDVYMVSHLQRMLGQEPDYSYLPRIYDTRALAKAYREELDKPRGDLLSWQYKIINDRTLKAKVSQNQLLKFFDIDFEEDKLHDALYDIKMCYKVFLKLKKHMDL
jgi:DNA polymerase III alpha subunit (gram-positive type)|tara:strand:- start:8226 stop:8840 length:615 start_codon:yes stop_codon:yes gene_type:complete